MARRPARRTTSHDLPFSVVAIAASAGGVKALSTVVESLPEDFPIPVLVVQHVDRRHRSLIAQILQRHTKLEVSEAKQGDKIAPGRLYVAPPDQHMLVSDSGRLNLMHTELVNFVRPSADLMFESVAGTYRDRAIGVVLTGSGSDGAQGIRAIKAVGGTTIAQDEATSEMFGMPGAAIATGSIDFVLPIQEIGFAITTLVSRRD